MANRNPSQKAGLEGINAADTELSFIDGEKGILGIRGRSIETLAFECRFEELCRYLWQGFSHGLLVAGESSLGPNRFKVFRFIVENQNILTGDLMASLQSSISLLGARLQDQESPEEVITAAIPVIIGAWHQRQHRVPLREPDPDLDHAQDFLRTLLGADPNLKAKSEALNTYLVAVSDHGMNASTFTARVIASTGSDLFSATTGAIGALKGPLHGGAPGPVLAMLDEIGQGERAKAWLTAELAHGRRIMGMGHRVYRVRDPRAAVFEQAIQRLEQQGVTTAKLKLAQTVEQAATELFAKRYPDRPIRANVEFYTAVLLDTIGLPRQLFSPVFAMGRVAGWCAHYLEQQKTGRLIRPTSHYVGPEIN